MNTTLVRRSTILSAACLAALIGSGVASAAPAQKALEALANRGPASDLQLPSHARAQSGVLGVLNAGALSASALELTLADGTKATARLQRVARDDKKGVQSWIGTFDDSPGSVLVLSKVNRVITGFANYKDQTLEVQPAQDGRHVLFAVDNARLPQIEEVDRPQGMAADSGESLGSDYGLGSASADAATSVVHDVLVVYTAASASRHGTANLESMIQSAVQAANQAYLNSQVAITMNLAGARQVGVIEGSSMSVTKSALQASTEVASLRDQLGADVVMLVSENSDYCGLASLMTTNSTSFASKAYGVVWSSCLSNQSLAHEVGHVQGMMHDRANSSYGGAYPYSYGYRVCVSDGTGFRDIMSYSCSGAPRVLLFSNPNLNFNGHAAGVSYEASPSTSAENARTLTNTAATVAAFRGGTSTVSPSTAPAVPTSLAVTNATHSQVSLAWTDNATNETGFKLDRSADGVNFAEIATLGADAKSFIDSTVTARSTFYYRVRAFNSAGMSGYSSTVNVTTPDVPPPPPPPPASPSSLSALGGVDGTASVSWTTEATTASSFEVRRETWNSLKSTWTSAVTAASVPSTVLSIVDSTGAGTFRYLVRAVNAGGASQYVGPAAVTVSAAPSNTSTKKIPPAKGKR